MDSDLWCLPFRLVIKLRGSSGPLTASMTEEFLAKVIAKLFPRVEPFAFPPTDFPYDENRDTAVTEGEVRLFLDATSKRHSSPEPNGVHSRRVRRGAVCASLRDLHSVFQRHFRHRERKLPSAARQTG